MEALKRVVASQPVLDLCRDGCIGTATFYKWRAKFSTIYAWMMTHMTP